LRRAYAIVRQSAPNFHQTYGISLGIMFLSRYGAPDDKALIRSLTLRLLAAQDPNGGWSYQCPILKGDQEKAWEEYFATRENLSKPEPNPNAGFAPGSQIKPDNSNTQFAILALWLGRKTGGPVNYGLGRAECRFGQSQGGDGGWPYGMGGVNLPGAGMTCAGLLALAVGHGKSQERQAKFQSGGPDAPPAPAENKSPPINMSGMQTDKQ